MNVASLVDALRSRLEATLRPLDDVSVDVDKVPSTAWTLDTSAVADFDLSTLATSLTTVVRERFGAVFVYPDLEARTTQLRLEWQLDRRRRYWWRLGIVVAGSSARAPALSAYVGPGDAHKSGTVDADAEEQQAITREFTAVLEAAARRARGTTGRQRVLFYLELPGPWSVDLDTALPAFGAELFSGMVVRPNQAYVSAVVLTVPDESLVAARDRAVPIAAELAALLTLVAGAPVSLWRSQPPGFRHPPVVPDDNAGLYPRRFFRPGPPNLRRDLGRRAAVVAEVVGRLSSDDRDVVQRILLAYAAGKDVERRQPTIAAVAYMAALAAELKGEQCESETCELHGVTARHPLKGERDLIVERLVARGVIRDGERDDLRKLLGRTYGEQRSAFVHDAQFVHSERESSHLLGLPTADDLVSVAWRRRNDLHGLEALSRGLVFRELAARAGVDLVGPPVPVSVHERTGFEAAVHARPGVRLQVKSLSREPMYMASAPGAGLHIGLRDLVAGQEVRPPELPDADRPSDLLGEVGRSSSTDADAVP